MDEQKLNATALNCDTALDDIHCDLHKLGFRNIKSTNKTLTEQTAGSHSDTEADHETCLHSVKARWPLLVPIADGGWHCPEKNQVRN